MFSLCLSFLIPIPLFYAVAPVLHLWTLADLPTIIIFLFFSSVSTRRSRRRIDGPLSFYLQRDLHSAAQPGGGQGSLYRTKKTKMYTKERPMIERKFPVIVHLYHTIQHWTAFLFSRCPFGF